jgi:hypothetical protein
LLSTGGESSAHPVVVFSDQLTSAIDAPILVERNGRQHYLSAFEVVANNRYRYSVHAWMGERFESCRSSVGPSSILRLIDDYLVACEGLGEEWLLRDGQVQRGRTGRSNHARARLRAFHSAMMCAYPMSEVSEEVHAILRRVVEVQRSLAGSEEGHR